MTCHRRGSNVPVMQITDQIGRVARGFFLAGGVTLLGASSAAAMEPDDRAVPVRVTMTVETFLDRLMMAESGGRDTAKNPLSTALGPFQFINATFLDVVGRHFSEETAGLSVPQILALRTDRAFSRRVAQIYTSENARQLEAADVPATYPNLRLAFLLGPSGALRILQAPPNMRVAQLVGPGVLKANPFLHGLTASGLIARAARDLRLPPVDMTTGTSVAGNGAPRPELAAVLLPPVPSRASDAAAAGTAKKARAPKLNIRCNQALASCRKWVALQSRALVQKNLPPKRTKAAALR